MGVFNLILYPSLHLWCSLVGGAILCLGNLTWVLMAINVVMSAKKSNLSKTSAETGPAQTEG